MPVMIDLFAGRLGWAAAFLEAGWEVIAFDLVMPDMEIPKGVTYILRDILTLTADDLRQYGAIFATCSSPCEEFSVHGMKHFHPNPKWPAMGIKLFNHARALLEELGIPYVMENVRPARNFVGPSTAHCGPFHLWGPGVPSIFPPDAYKVNKGIDVGSSRLIRGMSKEEKRIYRSQFVWNQAWSSSTKRQRDTAKAAMIPLSVSRAVASVAQHYAEKA